MGDGVADLVAKTLGGNDGDFIADTLVGFEVEGEFWVVPLDDDLGRLLDGLRANATLQSTLAYRVVPDSRLGVLCLTYHVGGGDLACIPGATVAVEKLAVLA